MKYFMLDIETMGTDPLTDDVLEIGILEVNEVNGYYEPGRVYNRKFFTAQKPKNEWIATNHKELLKECRQIPMIEPEKVRSEILGFFKLCGETKHPQLMGLNLMSLDIPFMLAKGFLQKGDFHYRIYELRGVFNFASIVSGIEEKYVLKHAGIIDRTVELPSGKPHRAIFDCYKQLKTLNGLIRIFDAHP